MENQSKTEPDTVLRLIVARHTDAVHRDCKSINVTIHRAIQDLKLSQNQVLI